MKLEELATGFLSWVLMAAILGLPFFLTWNFVVGPTLDLPPITYTQAVAVVSTWLVYEAIKLVMNPASKSYVIQYEKKTSE